MHEDRKRVGHAVLALSNDLLHPPCKHFWPTILMFTEHFCIPSVFPPCVIVLLRGRQPLPATAGYSVQDLKAFLPPSGSAAFTFAFAQFLKRVLLHGVLCLKDALCSSDFCFALSQEFLVCF